MSGGLAAAVGGALLAVLVVLRLPVAAALLIAGGLGFALVAGVEPLLHYLKGLGFGRFSNYDLISVPLFLLMGQLAAEGGLASRLFEAARAWIGHRPGGLALASVGACAGFGALCGSSLATAGTLGRVAMPALQQAGYAPALATGALAAGGTLGILIPPSIVLVVFALVSEQNIAKLFLAALVPGLLAAAGYLAVVALWLQRDPAAGPPTPAPSSAARWQASRRVWPVLVMLGIVLGGLYGGVFTPVEAAAVGVLMSLTFGVLLGELAWPSIERALLGCGATTAGIFLILLGADLFNAFLALTQLPARLTEALAASGWPPLLILAAVLLGYLVLGCVMDSLSMVLLTVPLIFPMLMGLDFWGLPPEPKAIWLGILILTVVEIGLVTPPFGLNVFIIHSVARDVPLRAIFAGVLPFLVSDLLRIALLVLFPALSTFALEATRT